MSNAHLAAGRYHAALTDGLALAGSRTLADGPTAGELLLEAGYTRAIQPRLADLYRYPILAGLETMFDRDADEIARWVLAYYGEFPDLAAPLAYQTRLYARRAFDLGGQMGLDALELEGLFALEDEHVIEEIESHLRRLFLLRRQARLSLLVTTAEEIGREVSRQRDEGLTVTDVLPVLSAWVLGRTVIRSSVIAATESVRMSRWGMLWAFAGNGIRGVVHECALDVEQRCSGECPALCGTEYELGGVFHPMRGIPAAGQIPLHPKCRCWYSQISDGWIKPTLIWTGFALGALSD